METVAAPINGTKFSIWNWDTLVSHPQMKVEMRFKYLTEPPHGDFQYHLYLDDILLSEHLYWGRNLAITEDGKYLAVTRNLPVELVVVHLQDKFISKVANFSHIEGWRNHTLKYRHYVSSKPDVSDEFSFDVETN